MLSMCYDLIYTFRVHFNLYKLLERLNFRFNTSSYWQRRPKYKVREPLYFCPFPQQKGSLSHISLDDMTRSLTFFKEHTLYFSLDASQIIHYYPHVLCWVLYSHQFLLPVLTRYAETKLYSEWWYLIYIKIILIHMSLIYAAFSQRFILISFSIWQQTVSELPHKTANSEWCDSSRVYVDLRLTLILQRATMLPSKSFFGQTLPTSRNILLFLLSYCRKNRNLIQSMSHIQSHCLIYPPSIL